MTKDFQSITQVLLQQEQHNADRIYLKQPRFGQWHALTWGQVMQQARQVAAFLQKLGLKKGSHIAIFSKNCAEWFITDFGICLAGMVNVSLFPNQHENSIDYVLKHAEVKLVFIGKLDHHLRTRRYIPEHLLTVGFDYYADMVTNYRWADVLACEPVREVVIPKPDDLYTIIYSSGTSDIPKGAMYTHESVANYLRIFPGDIRRVSNKDHYQFVSYLPLVHVYERSTMLLGSLVLPAEVSFIENLDTFVTNLQTIKPTMFAAVPRIWDVFKHRIEQKVAPFLLSVPLVSWFVRKKIKQQIGLERCLGNISGAAHLPIDTLKFFDKIGIRILEGYGQTENLAYGTLSMFNDRKPGYVGAPRLEVRIKKGSNDELLMQSPCLMKGYYKDEEATAKAFTHDGWLRTGDIVEIDAKQRVKILGRLSDNFKNQKGEFISPIPIEEEFVDKRLIEQLCLVGKELVSNLMLVTLTKEARKMAKEEVTRALQDRLRATNKKLASYAKISQIVVAIDEWTTENELLTPTLKVKRRMLEERYRQLIHKAVSEPHTVIWE